MQDFEIGPWILQVDVKETRLSYSRLEGPHTSECDVITCANFAANRENVFPLAAQDELTGLGIDWRKELYLTHTGGVHGNRYHYNGWFLLVGHLSAEPIDRVTDISFLRGVKPYHWVDGLPYSDEYMHAFYSGRHLPGSAYRTFDRTRPLLQCQFHVWLPWAIDAQYTGP